MTKKYLYAEGEMARRIESIQKKEILNYSKILEQHVEFLTENQLQIEEEEGETIAAAVLQKQIINGTIALIQTYYTDETDEEIALQILEKIRETKRKKEEL